MKTRAMVRLEMAGVNYELKRHSKPALTAAEAARERGLTLRQVVKTMIVQGKSGHVAVALIPGDKTLSLKRLAQALGEKKVALVSADQVKRITGYEVGSISPIGITRQDVQILLDPKVLSEEYVSISSGSPNAGLLLKSKELASLLKARLAEMTH